MKRRHFEISCDKCGIAINHYAKYSPSDKKLREDGILVKGKKHYCSDCIAKDKWAKECAKTSGGKSE